MDDLVRWLLLAPLASWPGFFPPSSPPAPRATDCAILERWKHARGRESLGLFWFDRQADAWQQVWVTDDALRPFGTKEKSEVREFTADSRIRFEGRHAGATPGREVLDRTTLTRLDSGAVHQRIEISDDDGRTWKAVFVADYRPAGTSSMGGGAARRAAFARRPPFYEGDSPLQIREGVRPPRVPPGRE